MEQPITKALTAQVPAPLAAKVDRSHMTREALAEVNAGQVIDHQAVHAWAGSLSTTGRKRVRQ